MIRINNIKMPIDSEIEDLKRKVSKKLKGARINNFVISKKSIDARDKKNIFYVYSVDLEIDNEMKYINNKDILKIEIKKYEIKKIVSEQRPVIIGSGPCGLFAALILAESGLKPIILERGKNVLDRKKDVDSFFKTGILNEESNIQFGEGGAGTFSDGKLTTGVNDFRIKKVLEEFINSGAPEEIGYLAKPHIGTDKLLEILINIRKKIISLGGEYRFLNKLIDIEIKNDNLKALKIKSENGEYFIECKNAIFALGHSARETFRLLYDKKLKIERKNFSVGMRIEHLQSEINKSQYGELNKKLPAAEYKLNSHISNGRGVYTFCMCPGGEVVAAASENGRLVTNGMSVYKRNSENANSALLVGIGNEDFKDDGVFAGMDFQIQLEEKAFRLGGGNFKAPVQLLGDFLENKKSTSLGRVVPSYMPGYEFANLNECFSEEILFSFKKAVLDMNQKMNGFNSYDAVLTFAETRSSSPIRIVRDDKYESNIKGIFLAGEGAGYAGGIMTAAVDGIKAAEFLMEKIKK